MTRFAGFLATLLLSGGAARAADLNGTWDATILPGGEPVAFRMEIATSPVRVCFFEDTQPTCSTSARLEEGKLVAQWDYLKTELRLEQQERTLSGIYHSFRSNRDIKVEARPHQTVPPPAAPPANFGGEWHAYNAKRPGPAWQILLRQFGSEIKGTILRVDGDDGVLTGRVDGKHLVMSHFAGDRPVALSGDLQADGSLALKVGAAELSALRPTAARARNLPPPADPATWAKAKTPEEPFRFRFRDLNGRDFTDADFKGRPLIATITGSWCPNCRDEAPFLGELYKQYHAKGLEIAAFCFEDAGDTEHVQLRAFLRKFAITYPALLAGEPAELKAAVPQIENLSAFPSSIYIGRDGRIRAVHTGFPSPGSGEELTRVKEEIRTLVERMLADPEL
jgi:thiol-disulfide isomerase/thioredoxin